MTAPFEKRGWGGQIPGSVRTCSGRLVRSPQALASRALARPHLRAVASVPRDGAVVAAQAPVLHEPVQPRPRPFLSEGLPFTKQLRIVGALQQRLSTGLPGEQAPPIHGHLMHSGGTDLLASALTVCRGSETGVRKQPDATSQCLGAWGRGDVARTLRLEGLVHAPYPLPSDSTRPHDPQTDL